jgi:uncharacterized protein with HEPN domain
VKDDLFYIDYILECITRIERYTRAGRQSFFSESMIADAVVRNLHTLAESSQRISDRVKQTTPEIDWRGLAGFRNVVVHDYLGLELGTIWDIVAIDLPALRAHFEQLRERLGV